MDLREKLRQMENTSPLKRDDLSAEKAVDSSTQPVSSIIGGELYNNSGGEYLIKREKILLESPHGLYCPDELSPFTPKDFYNITGEKISYNFNYHQLLFIDTETTGLMGGTGTLPFLIGIGYFQKDYFYIDQYFMRDYDDELAVLMGLQEFWKDYKLMVSFNGKTFDLPLLKTRFIMNRLQAPEKNQLDLLHPARRIWSYLSSCSLGNLENEILSIDRGEDLPGREVPALYFEYLDKSKPEFLSPIFAHNRDDIISLVTLLIHLKKIHKGEIEDQLSVEELFNLGKIEEKRKNLQESINYYEKALHILQHNNCNNQLRKELEIRLSWQYKRADKWDKAVEIWQEMISNSRGRLFPYIELAKYFEHQTGNHVQAHYITKNAYHYLKEKRPLINNFSDKKSKLEHRLKRLNKKIN